MKRYLVSLISVGIMAVSPLTSAASEFAQDVKWTPEKMMEFVDINNRGVLSTGFYECMVAQVKNQPYEGCLPGEVAFQEQVLNSVVSEYKKQLGPSEVSQFNNIQKAFETYRAQECHWYDNPKVIANRFKPISNPQKMKLKCLLDATVARRLELEGLLSQGD